MGTTTAKENQLLAVIQDSGIEEKTSNNILEKFTPLFEQASEWKAKAESLVVTSADQKKEMAEARVARIELKKLRVESDKIRKALKEDSIRYGKAVQGVYNVIEYLIKPIEEHLLQQERFVEIQEANRIEALRQVRNAEAERYQDFLPYGLDLGPMSEEDYSRLIEGAKMQQQAKIEAEKKAEEERIARAEAEKEERKRIAAENLRLKKEAEERERKAKIEAEKRAKEEAARLKKEAEEKKKQEEKLRKEREERERIQAELKAKEEAEAKAKKEAEEREWQARMAPDKAKLKALAVLINQIELPTLQTKEGEKIIGNIRGLLNKVSNYAQEQADKL